MKNQTKRHAFRLLALSFFVSLIGCLPTYVGDPEKAVLDPALIGIWHKADQDQDDFWAVHKMNDHCYLVQAYIIRPREDGKRALDATMTSRAWLTPIGGQTFISLEIFAMEALLKPEAEAAKIRYLVAKLVMGKNGVTIQALNPDFLKNKPVTTPAELEKVIAENIDSPTLLTEKAVYTRVDRENADKFKALLDLIK
ncbi:MAG: hypothetical protein H7144_15390 [Burkholderiales bacterium]|nr:hypothetical protein [Phycisphaerae bacterium]